MNDAVAQSIIVVLFFSAFGFALAWGSVLQDLHRYDRRKRQCDAVLEVKEKYSGALHDEPIRCQLPFNAAMKRNHYVHEYWDWGRMATGAVYKWRD